MKFPNTEVLHDSNVPILATSPSPGFESAPDRDKSPTTSFSAATCWLRQRRDRERGSGSQEKDNVLRVKPP